MVELLVVIAIIGILAAILIPTLYRVVIKARQSKIAQELDQLHLAVESYKQKFGDYPPDFTTFTAADLTPTVNANHLVVRHLRKAFGRPTENLDAAFRDPTSRYNDEDLVHSDRPEDKPAQTRNRLPMIIHPFSTVNSTSGNAFTGEATLFLLTITLFVGILYAV